MTPYGFQINQLRVTGPSRPNAFITFGSGFSLISGDSDTGKSYTFQCLQYALGRGTTPKAIDESAGYRTLLVELRLARGRTVTIERGIRGAGDLKLYEVALSDLDSNTPARLLGETHDSS